MNPISKEQIGAVIVTFNPDAGLLQRLCRILGQVALVVIVDNGSTASAYGAENLPRVRLLRNDRNMGVAHALNQGLKLLCELGFVWAITLDQDSTPMPGMVEELLRTLSNVTEPDRVALVGPNFTDQGAPDAKARWLKECSIMPIFFERVACASKDLSDVTMINTSGALTNLEIFKKVGPLKEDFFIDYVDTEYCLRVRRMNYQILVSCRARLLHNLGEKRAVKFLFFVVRPTFHKPFRRYYISRNRIYMIREYAAAFPHWFAFDLMAGAYNGLRVILFEDNRWQKIKAFLNGAWDGLRQRYGEQPGSLR